MKSKKILALFAAGMISFATSANAAYNLTLVVPAQAVFGLC